MSGLTIGTIGVCAGLAAIGCGSRLLGGSRRLTGRYVVGNVLQAVTITTMLCIIAAHSGAPYPVLCALALGCGIFYAKILPRAERAFEVTADTFLPMLKPKQEDVSEATPVPAKTREQ